MIKKLMTLVVIGLCIAQFSSLAQQNNLSISGQIKDDQGKAFDLATVALFTLKDSLLVKTMFTENDGKFIFNQLKPGTYQIRVSSMGYSTYRSTALNLNTTTGNLNLGDLKLMSSSKALKEVNINFQKAFVERKIDRTVVNVDALISNAGTTALDVLGNAPGISIDQNGNISLKGKQGVNIFIDDKPTYLSGADLENYLRSLPSSALNQIEIMTNPPARYDAAGNAGVINIKTKKSKLSGFNGGLNLGLTQGEKTRSNNSFNFNYYKDKVNIFGNLSYNLNNSFTDLDLNRTYKNSDGSPKSYFNQNSYFKRHGNTYNIKTGLDYYQSDNTTWGIVLTGMNRISSQINDNTSNLLNLDHQPYSIIKAKNLDDIHYKNGAVNLNYRHKFGKSGKELTFDADYLVYRNQTDQTYYNDTYSGNNQLTDQDRLNGDLPSNIDIYTFKSDYSQPLNKEWKLDAGVKSSYIKTNNTATYLYTYKGLTSPDYEKSNHFIYKENINAGYINLRKEGKRFSVQAGLRLENTVSDGHQLGNVLKPDSSFRRTYTSLFPTVYLSYKLDTMDRHQFGLNYGRRIDRPYYQDLNPFFNPLDKFTYYVGNPFLKPAFTQSLELSHTYKNKLTTTIGYSKTKDDFNETIEIVDGIYYSRPGNIGTRTQKSIAMDGGLDITKWLTFHVYAEYGQIHSETNFYTGFLVTNGDYFRSNGNVQFKFGKDWSAELNYRYQSRQKEVQFLIGSVHDFGAGIQKKLSPSTTLKLSINDIFRTRIYTGVINNLANAEASWRNRGDFRNAVLSFSYRFGKAISNNRKHDASGAEAEQNRVKN
ncbi:TonB-dependent receptor [Pedobacter nutrimenti]|uniref:Outer membrane receptor protein involved in Fe transport n=1 Tax=Pedobacter nutrimenti TaxID=1241337 RepID=A0A318UBD2_9SPHI|nr:TonB-dependent receptor [Pedobacter nutrimenti]PYF72843.1 outer membrane receptor protein involved in Fe transport [Pedobacter nutrimenti]